MYTSKKLRSSVFSGRIYRKTLIQYLETCDLCKIGIFQRRDWNLWKEHVNHLPPPRHPWQTDAFWQWFLLPKMGNFYFLERECLTMTRDKQYFGNSDGNFNIKEYFLVLPLLCMRGINMAHKWQGCSVAGLGHAPLFSVTQPVEARYNHPHVLRHLESPRHHQNVGYFT